MNNTAIEKARPMSTRLVWASLNGNAEPAFTWFGLGLLSDFGLPLDVLQMVLAAKDAVGTYDLSAPIVVLLADSHAISIGAAPSLVASRATNRRAEVHAIGRALGLRCTVVLASEIERNAAYLEQHSRARAFLANHDDAAEESSPAYTVRGVADDLFFGLAGGLKIGWSKASTLRRGEGRHHEPETDLIASEIDPCVSALYVRAGTTLDSKRPTAVPYTELHDPSKRLMLTGPDCGRFDKKLNSADLSPRRARAVIEHLAITVEAFQQLVTALDGEDLVNRAETLVTRVNLHIAPTSHLETQTSEGGLLTHV